MTQTTDNIKRMKAIIVSAKSILEGLGASVDKCRDDLVDLQEAGNATIMVKGGERAPIGRIGIKALAFYYFTKQSMLAVTDDADFFNDVKDCINYHTLKEEVLAIKLFMRNIERIKKAQTRVGKAEHAYYHLSVKIRNLEDGLAVKESGADMLDNIEV